MPKARLYGGRKPVDVRIVRVGKKIGKGEEGIVSNAKITLFKGNQRRTLANAFVQKRFFKPEKGYGDDLLRRPKEQFEMITRLKEWNRNNGNQVRIPKTVRIAKIKGKHVLIMSKLQLLKIGKLSEEQLSEFHADRRRQIGLLNNAGFLVTWLDTFSPQKHAETGRIHAVLHDFSAICEQRKNELNGGKK